MFRHIVLYRLKDRSEEAKQALKEKFLRLRENIPQGAEPEVGTDCLYRRQIYDVALAVTLGFRENLSAHKDHPFHVGVSEYVHSAIESLASCGFEGEA